MTTDDLTLARRAVASPHWDWHSLHGCAVLTDTGEPIGRLLGYCNADWWVMPERGRGEYIEDLRPRPIGKLAGRDPDKGGWMLPDLTDPLTLHGGVLTLVREAWPGWRVSIYEQPTDPVWEVELEQGLEFRTFHGNELREALVSALEAAPCSE